MNDPVAFLSRQRLAASEAAVDRLREDLALAREAWLRAWEVLRELPQGTLQRIEGARAALDEGEAEFGKEAP